MRPVELIKRPMQLLSRDIERPVDSFDSTFNAYPPHVVTRMADHISLAPNEDPGRDPSEDRVTEVSKRFVSITAVMNYADEGHIAFARKLRLEAELFSEAMSHAARTGCEVRQYADIKTNSLYELADRNLTDYCALRSAKEAEAFRKKLLFRAMHPIQSLRRSGRAVVQITSQ